MPTTSDYLTQLEQDRQDLIDNLETQGISGLTGNETFTELVPKVLEIGGDTPSETVWYSNVFQFDGWDNTTATSVTTAGDFAYSGDDVKALYKGHKINMVRLVPGQAGVITFRVYNDDENIVGSRNSASLRDGQSATITITSAMVSQGGYQEIPLSNELTIGENQFWSVQTSGDTGRFKFVGINKSSWNVSQGYRMYNNLGTTNAVVVQEDTTSYAALCVDVGYKSPLSSRYQEVKYITSSGTQYIDTGVANASGVYIEAKIKYNSLGFFNCFIGSQITPNNAGNGSQAPIIAYDTTSDYTLYEGYSSHRTNLQINTTTPQIIKSSTVDGNVFMNVDGSNYSNNSNAGQTRGNKNLYLFAMNNGGTAGFNASGNLYYLKIYDNVNGNLVRNFVPCYRISDDVIGLYDLVNGVFYTNDGTGVFTKGSNV